MRSKNKTIIPNGTSESSSTDESEDELFEVKKTLQNRMSNANESSTSEGSEIEEKEEKNNLESKKKKKKRIHWLKKTFVAPKEGFMEVLPPPPTDDELKPIDYFNAMFGINSYALLTEQSNLYSVQFNPNKPANISETEIRQFIGVLIMTGVYSFPEQRFFWKGSTRVESIASNISRDRFLQIKKFLHVVDNTEQLNSNDPNYDRAFKVRPLLNIVKENFRRIPKEEKLCVDEQMIPYKGKSIMKQHMPSKPIRWGYKMFLLAGGESGICYDFVLYTGKGDKAEYGFCTDIVLTLCETVPRNLNHQLYCDNYFTTIRLQVELKKMGIFATGTVKSNRLTDLSVKQLNDLSKEGRGAVDHRVAEVDGIQVCVTRWFDNNVVNCLSTLHDNQIVDSVKRWSTKQKQHIQVKRPAVIKAYNQWMGGVDLIDMLISLYRINVRCRKFYMKIIFHLIDLSIANGWLLYRRHGAQLNYPRREIMSLLEFRIEIANTLLKPAIPIPPVRRGRPSHDQSSNADVVLKTKRAAPIPRPPAIDRSDCYNHWPMMTSKGRCRLPGCRGYSSVCCSKCRQRLCLNERNNCFKAYHLL